ncbi:MAG TPA: secretin N-terminal domain-containing protein, partial [bacterium]|nr:secretin N-terminal domain-containing protein [bacterium]
EQRTNTLIIPDIGANVAKLLEIIEKIDVPSPPGKEEYRVYRLENSNAEELAKVLNDILSRKRAAPVVRAPGVTTAPVQASVVAAKATNSLIIYADPDDFSTLEKIIKDLDVMTNQVLIEALIAEVTYEKEKEFGFEWSVVDAFWKDKVTGSVETKFDLDTAIPSGMKIAVTKGISDIGSLIRLYGKDQRFNILSTPQIVTADNQEAMINISENRPYLKETRFIGTYYTGAGQDTIKSFDYKDVGIILKITPQISRDKYVKLKINQSVTKVLTVGTQGELTTAKREADTTLIVPNNQTVVLGGLIRNDTEKVVHKVPFFGDIPGLKYLFRHQRDAGTKTNLLIFITPHIITSFEQAERLRQEKEKLMQEIKK